MKAKTTIKTTKKVEKKESEKSYSLTIKRNAEGEFTSHRVNHGFSTAELIGILELVKNSLLKEVTEISQP